MKLSGSSGANEGDEGTTEQGHTLQKHMHR